MDLKALAYTRDHYNAHSNQYGSVQEALHARATGPGAPLKKFHNEIKRQLINRCVCGRGRGGRGGRVMAARAGRRRGGPRPSTPPPPRERWALCARRFAGDAESLLDLACGRGGDIWKWIDAGILHVKGVDLSPGEIAEARKR